MDKESGARKICVTLRGAGHRALWAGGCVRDRVLGRSPKDYDIATSALPEEIENLFDKCAGAGAVFGVQIVTIEEGSYEVATFRLEGPYLDGRHPSTVEFRDEQTDALRRDFTINALFYDPECDEIVDYVDGLADLDSGIIRAVGDPEARFREDHLRLLRAVRFSARLNYEIETETFAAVHDCAALISKTSAERVRDELVMMLTEGSARRAFELLDATGLLERILPEIWAMKGVEQPPEFHPEGDVFVHTLMLLENLDKPSATLAFAALLHDVGKPLTQTFEDRIRFNFHDKVGTRETRKICRRLRMTNEDTERITWLVSQHMRVAVVRQMRESKRKRLLREDGFAELVELFRLDCLASHNRMDSYDWLVDYASNLKPEEVRPTALMSGAKLISMGFTPGPLFSEILTAVEDAQLEGGVADEAAAEEFVRASWSVDNAD